MYETHATIKLTTQLKLQEKGRINFFQMFIGRKIYSKCVMAEKPFANLYRQKKKTFGNVYWQKKTLAIVYWQKSPLKMYISRKVLYICTYKGFHASTHSDVGRGDTFLNLIAAHSGPQISLK